LITLPLAITSNFNKKVHLFYLLFFKKLERQLKDIAYGTKQVKVGHENMNELILQSQQDGGKRRSSFSFVGSPTSNLDHQLIVNLERGQNIFEIHLTKVNISKN
jgi:hypothetical protein